MAFEPRRACGYRKVGGLYLVSDNTQDYMPCCRLPIPLHVCPVCHQGIKQTRGWTWIDPKPFVAAPCKFPKGTVAFRICGMRVLETKERVGLLWVGERFYPTPAHFMQEVNEMGLSRRIIKPPRGLKLGEDWVFMAHPKAIAPIDPMRDPTFGPGVFHVFKPSRIEKIITETQARDEKEMEKLHARNITPVVVPDDDRDHQGSVYEKEETAQLPL
jgi:hypothetical protein